MAETCLASQPDYEPEFYAETAPIKGQAVAAVISSFTEYASRVESFVEQICVGWYPNPHPTRMSLFEEA